MFEFWRPFFAGNGPYVMFWLSYYLKTKKLKIQTNIFDKNYHRWILQYFRTPKVPKVGYNKALLGAMSKVHWTYNTFIGKKYELDINFFPLLETESC